MKPLLLPERAADPDKAADALVAIRPKGLMKVVTIAADGDTPRVRCFTLPAERDAMRDYIARHDGKRNIYCEPNPPKVKAHKRSKESDIAAAVFGYVDCDPKLDGKPEDPAKAQARHHKRLNSGVVPKPTFEYVSGGGTVGMWKYETPIKLNDLDSIQAAKAINIGLARQLGTSADGYDTCQSLDHLYRVPNTTNLPNEKKRAAGREKSIAGDLRGNASRRYERAALPVGKVDTFSAANDIGEPIRVDLAQLTISDRSRAIIETGEAEGKRPGDDSPSGWRMSLIHCLKGDGVDDETVLGILLHPDNMVSAERAAKAGSRKAAETFFKKEIGKANALRNANASDDFDDDVSDISDGDDESDSGAMDFNTPAELEFDLAPYIPKDPSKIPTRKWLYGTAYIRKFIGLTAATGGAGKSSLILVECVAMACGKDLLGIEPAKKLHVLYWNGEDPLEELERRVEAILKHYKLTKADLGDRLFIKSGRDMPIRIAELDQGRAQIAKPMTRAMVKAIRTHKLDVVAIDPFVSSHGVPENDNNAIELVAKKWADIADKTDCAVILSHHTRKTNGLGASIEDSRGASALNYAARTRRAINTMTAAEAKAAGFADNDRSRLSYFKADMLGSSMIKPTAALDWYRFVSVDLMNGPPDELTGAPTEGDSVGVVEKWEYTKLILELSVDDMRDAVAALHVDAPWRYNGRAAKWAGLAIARAAGVEVTDATVRARIAALIEEWIKDGTLEKYQEKDDDQRRTKVFVRPTMVDDDGDIDFG